MSGFSKKRATRGRNKRIVFDILFNGEEHAQTAKELAEILQMDARAVTLEISEERRAGRPICASSNSKNPGYYIPNSQFEMQRFCRSLENRENEIKKTREACEETIKTLPED